jgi:hypothetical protein
MKILRMFMPLEVPTQMFQSSFFSLHLDNQFLIGDTGLTSAVKMKWRRNGLFSRTELYTDVFGMTHVKREIFSLIPCSSQKRIMWLIKTNLPLIILDEPIPFQEGICHFKTWCFQLPSEVGDRNRVRHWPPAVSPRSYCWWALKNLTPGA